MTNFRLVELGADSRRYIANLRQRSRNLTFAMYDENCDDRSRGFHGRKIDFPEGRDPGMQVAVHDFRDGGR